jgi:hypothetical protein
MRYLLRKPTLNYVFIYFVNESTLNPQQMKEPKLLSEILWQEQFDHKQLHCS